MVADEDKPVGLRIGAWIRLIKVFGAMRSDDLQRTQPRFVRLSEGGLAARLVRTKTSGAGKKVKEMVVFIPRNAWVIVPE